ncbi:MAG: 4Fe-4S binding protein [Methanosarcinaceae archaeon]|nr:4Fe-4S binding protein [Methanosarcinaceae archaeon]MDD4332460.1 4Fe-4S binding protein [Methanosarcinaceae archaeon]MDD4749229.1 4Fe-4S binding protein [Methanosarcinaceae archaeon]
MKIKIIIPTERIQSPLIAESMVETGVLLNIMVANIDSTYGELIADVDTTLFHKLKEALEKRGAFVTTLDQPIHWDEEECVECGACISVCPMKVYSFDKEWNLCVDEKKCIRCGMCIKMCPHQALKLGD